MELRVRDGDHVVWQGRTFLTERSDGQPNQKQRRQEGRVGTALVHGLAGNQLQRVTHSNRAVCSDANAAHICAWDAVQTPQMTAHFSIEPVWQRAIGLYRGHRFRVFAAAFAINVATASFAHALQLDAVRGLEGHAPAWRRLAARYLRVLSRWCLRASERSAEIRHRRWYLPSDLHADPAYAIDSNTWRTWRKTEKDPRRMAGFLGDIEFPFDYPPPPLQRTREPPTPPQDDEEEDNYNYALAYHNEEAKDDSDDCVACIFQEWQLAMAEGREFEYPATMTDDKITRLGVLVSEVDRPVQPPLPWYATDIMPSGLTEEEALRRALEDSAPQPVQPPPPPSPYNPWAAPPPPPEWAAQPPPQTWAAPSPPPPAAPVYVPPLANWSWPVLELVVIDSDDDDE
ncbi:hypothetical protein QYE76_040637 [Lolium multiflorum]|uniref:Uncharacterized protein n=1 Tax=Lolium multiflorum TaxID=4521 RepID=A0AAD8WTE0_LOLMU|nr:hypothetical protein QYE76_040637 [Lolium multiflorum]